LDLDQVFFPQAQAIRQTQRAFALRAALKVSTSPEQSQAANFYLAQVFAEQPQYFEPYVSHYREYLRLSRELGRLLLVPREMFAEGIKQEEAHLKVVEDELKKRRDFYEINSANKQLLEPKGKIDLAVRAGLAETAVNLLLGADPAELRDKAT